jgi:uncharacterized protein
MIMSINYNFEWDPKKASDNIEKHGVSFEEAATVFTDPMALSILDKEHSETEDRWITMGISGKGRLLVVCHTFRKESEAAVGVRIISTPKATKRETKTYGE